MAGKITTNGLIHVAERIAHSLGGASPTVTFAFIEIGTGATAATVGDAGVQTPLAIGGRIALTSGWPKIVTLPSTQRAIEFKGTFAAGTFSTGSAITEAAIRENSGGGQCFGRAVLDTPKSPTASEPLDVTLQFPLSDE